MEKLARNTTSYLDMLKTKGSRHRVFISISLGIFAQWNGVGIASYYLAQYSRQLESLMPLGRPSLVASSSCGI